MTKFLRAHISNFVCHANQDLFKPKLFVIMIKETQYRTVSTCVLRCSASLDVHIFSFCLDITTVDMHLFIFSFHPTFLRNFHISKGRHIQSADIE